MKRILLLISLALILAALGSHWYLVRQVEASLDRLASQLAPIGQLSWEGVRVDWHGEARVERLELRPRDSRDPVRVDLLRLSAGGPLSLIGLSQDVIAMRLPARLKMNIEGLSLPVNREIDALIGALGLALPFAAAGCADYENFSFYDLGELGLAELHVDLNLSFQLVNQEEEIDLSSRAYIRGLGDRRWRLRLALDESDRSLANLDSLMASSLLLSFEQEYLDLGYYPRLLAFCATQTGLDLNDQIDWHLQAWVEQWEQAGLQPGPLVIAGYRHFLHQPQMLSVRATHETGIGWTADREQSLVELILADMDTSFNLDEGTPVSLSFESTQPPIVAIRRPELEPAPADIPLEPDSDIELGMATDWIRIEPSQAAAHISHRAQIQSRDGQRFGGRIAAVDDAFLHLTSRSRIGEFTRPIALDDIESLRVRP